MGSIACLIYWFSFHILPISGTCSQRKHCLIIPLLFYLVPLPLGSNYLRDFYNLIAAPLPLEPLSPYTNYLGETLFQTTDGYYYYQPKFFYILFFAVWTCLLICFLFYQAYNYRKLKRQLSLVPILEDSVLIETLNLYKEQLHIHRKIKLICVPGRHPPFTVGFLNPTIILSTDFTPKELELILNHELYHIKNLDSLWKLLYLLTIGLHWFNPFSYFLFSEFSKVAELTCDECVTRNFTRGEKDVYVNLLLNLAEIPTFVPKKHSVFIAHLKPFNESKERLRMLKKNNRKKSILCWLIAIISIISSTLPAFAYTPVRLENDSFYGSEYYESNSFFLVNDDETSTLAEEIENFEFSDEYIILNDGTIIYPSADDSIVPYCSHTFVNSTAKYHISDGGTGCYVDTWSVRVCSRCGYREKIALISQTHYINCPH